MGVNKRVSIDFSSVSYQIIVTIKNADGFTVSEVRIQHPDGLELGEGFVLHFGEEIKEALAKS